MRDSTTRDVDVRDMAIVHQFYRREFTLAPQILRQLGPEASERRRRAQEWFAITLEGMRHHHLAEDELMYPLMRGLVPGGLLELMEAQHQAVEAGLTAVQHRLEAWTAGGPGTAEALAESFDAVLPVLAEHLDEEERLIVPLIAGCLTAEQYGRMATSGNGVVEPRALMMSFGGMIEQCSDEDAEFMLSHLRPEVLQSWHDHLAAEYRGLMALLRGDLHPIEPAFQG